MGLNPSRVALRYASRVDFNRWKGLASNANPMDLGSLETYVGNAGIESIRSPKDALEAVVWEMGYEGEPLPKNKNHWIWRLSVDLKIDIKKEYALGALR